MAKLPFTELALAALSATSVVAAIETHHWFAAPFAMLFTFGYGYVATLVLRDQLFVRRSSQLPTAPALQAEDNTLAKAA